MDLTVLTSAAEAETVLPALELLPHRIRCAAAGPELLMGGDAPDAVVVDAREDLAEARATCRLMRTAGQTAPLLAVVTEAGLAAVHSDWGVDDVIVHRAGPAEVEARLRLAAGRREEDSAADSELIRVGDLTIDGDTYAAKLKGRPLNLTFREFELLRHLAAHPGRVFTREQLLRQVWGYDYFGGMRTVDVHVRRLRAKLGSEHESLIATVRQVGYKFVSGTPRPLPEASRAPEPRRERRTVTRE